MNFTLMAIAVEIKSFWRWLIIPFTVALINSRTGSTQLDHPRLFIHGDDNDCYTPIGRGRCHLEPFKCSLQRKRNGFGNSGKATGV